jgi:uncharacterized protein
VSPSLDLRGLRPALLAVLLAFFWLGGSTARAQASSDLAFPALSGRVVDQADLISPEAEAALTTKLATLERDTTDQVVVVTLTSLQGQEIEDYGYRLGRAWRIGQGDKNNGLLLIVAPDERKVRIEVGYGLEPIMTDALSALIIHNQILPSFREGYFERGIQQGVDAIDQQLRLDPAEAQARAVAAEAPRSRIPVGTAIVVGVVLLLLFSGMIGGLAHGGRRRRGSGLSPILIWAASEAMRGGRGGGGGSWGGGGGFGGGGGSFGGGGASGGW